MKEISIEWSGPFNLNELKDFDLENNFNFYFFYSKKLEIKFKPEITIRSIYWYIGSSVDPINRVKNSETREDFKELFSNTYNRIDKFVNKNPRFNNLINSLFTGFYDRLDELNEFMSNWLVSKKTDLYFGMGFENSKTIPKTSKKLILAIENGLIYHFAKYGIGRFRLKEYTFNINYTKCYRHVEYQLKICNYKSPIHSREIYTKSIPKC